MSCEVTSNAELMNYLFLGKTKNFSCKCIATSYCYIIMTYYMYTLFGNTMCTYMCVMKLHKTNNVSVGLENFSVARYFYGVKEKSIPHPRGRHPYVQVPSKLHSLPLHLSAHLDSSLYISSCSGLANESVSTKSMSYSIKSISS